MRLVDADKIRWKSYPNDYGETNDDYVGKCDIDNMPTVDAVPVVYCKDCKHLCVWNRKDIYAFCPKTNIVFLPFEKDTRTFFCSFGERKENNHEKV